VHRVQLSGIGSQVRRSPGHEWTRLRVGRRLKPASDGYVHKALVPLVQRLVRPCLDYNVDAAAAVKRAVSIPVIAVGGIRTLARMNEIIDSGKADFVALSRPFIREPSFVSSLKAGRQMESRCHSCAYCALAQETEPLRCHDGKITSSR
jgi:2,4-dienoyl-CoA reductase-like NADH-dependent reductase (Old Yellow Enzyme family)